MKLVVSKLSPREEVAFGAFLRRHFASWQCELLPEQRPSQLPPADLYVLDLAPMGFRHGSEQALATLLDMLHGKPAVLLLPAHEGSWSALDIPAEHRPHLLWLHKPYSTDDMRKALDQAAASAPPAEQAPQAVPTPAPAPVAVVVAIPPAPIAPPMPAPKSTSLAPGAAEVPEQGLTIAELQARLAALPQPAQGAFLSTLAQWLASGEPFEARFTLQHMLLVHPQNGWVAFNTPLAVIDRICSSNAMASAVALRHIGATEAETLVQRMRLTLQELEPFLLRLFNATHAKAS